MSILRNPWGKPRFLALFTGGYILWSVLPVLIAIAFAFNDGRSRTTWQGFSTRWFTGETGSVLHDDCAATRSDTRCFWPSSASLWPPRSA